MPALSCVGLVCHAGSPRKPCSITHIVGLSEMLYKQLPLYWVICKLLWSHEKPPIGSHGLGGEVRKSCQSCQASWGA